MQFKIKNKMANCVDPDEKACYKLSIWIYIVFKAAHYQPSHLDLHRFQSYLILFVCVEVLRSSQPNGVMSSAVSLPNHMYTGQA